LDLESPPVYLRSLVVLSSFDVQLVLLDGSCNFVQLYSWDRIPVVDYLQDLGHPGAEVGVGGQHVSHQVLHLLRLVVGFVLDAGVDDAEFALFLEGVEVVVEHEEDASEHPDIDSVIDGVFEVQIDHFWRTVHQRRILFEPFLVVVHLGLRYLFEIDPLAAAAPKIT